jgi:hypothetical protein
VELTSRKSLPVRLVKHLTADFQQLLGHVEPIAVRRIWMSRHPYSCVFRVDFSSSNDPHAIFLKCPDSPEPPVKQLRWAERFKEEFRVLERLWQQFGEAADIGVVRPLNFYPEFSTLATVAAPGMRLRRLLKSSLSRSGTSNSGYGEVQQYLVLAGQWLRQFHNLTAEPEQPIDSDALLEYCEDRLVALQHGTRPSLPPHIARQILSRLERIAVDSGPVQMAGCHGDFMSHNIMVHEGQMRVLDFTMYEEGPVIYDPCSLWSELEIMKHEARANKDHLAFLQHTFLKAYGPQVSPDQPLFKAIHVRHLLVALCKTVMPTRSGLLSQLSMRRRADIYRHQLRSFAASGS